MPTEPTISIKQEHDFPAAQYAVTLEEGNDVRTYSVSMSEDYYQHLGIENNTPEEVVDAAFRFLLDREPKDAILTEFDLTDIKSYFPDFEEVLPSYLNGAS